MDPKTTTQEDKIAWFRKLDKEIWEVHNKGEKSNARSIGQYRTEKRKLTYAEWLTFVCYLDDLIADRKVVAVPGAGVFGFRWSLNVHTAPLYPGVDYPEFLISLVGNHLPDHENKPRDYVWNVFERFTHTKENKELAKWRGFGEFMGKDFYDY